MTNQNLAPIPEGWSLDGYRQLNPAIPQYAFIDYAVTHNGHPSIRLDQGGMEDPYYPGLIDRAIWLVRRWPIKAGDRIVFKIWIKMPPNPKYPNDPYQGGRCGIDGYLGDTDLAPEGEVWNSDHVPWGSDWTQRTRDFIVASGIQSDHILPWIQVRPGEDPLSGWFADAEFYINPETPPPPECVVDGDCPVGYHCENGVCVVNPPPECVVDDDCPVGYHCETGVCVPDVASPMWVATECGLSQVDIDWLRYVGHLVLPKAVVDWYHSEGEDFAGFLKTHPVTKRYVKLVLDRIVGATL